MEHNVNIRWSIEKKVWREYMHKFINIDCFFIEGTVPIEEFQTIQTEAIENMVPGIYHKSLIALKELKDTYDFYLRTNLSSFVNFNTLSKLLNELRNREIFYGGPCDPANWVSGTSIVMSSKVVSILVKYGFQNKYYNDKNTPDDVLIGKVLKDQKIFCDPRQYHFLHTWNYSHSYNQNMKEIIRNDKSIYRLKTQNISQYKNLSRKLLKNIYKK